MWESTAPRQPSWCMCSVKNELIFYHIISLLRYSTNSGTGSWADFVGLYWFLCESLGPSEDIIERMSPPVDQSKFSSSKKLRNLQNKVFDRLSLCNSHKDGIQKHTRSSCDLSRELWLVRLGLCDKKKVSVCQNSSVAIGLLKQTQACAHKLLHFAQLHKNHWGPLNQQQTDRPIT